MLLLYFISNKFVMIKGERSRAFSHERNWAGWGRVEEFALYRC